VGATSLHANPTRALGQSPKIKLAELTYDPFVSQEKPEASRELLAHYQVPLVDGNSVFLEYKTGKYVSCNPPGSGQPDLDATNPWSVDVHNSWLVKITPDGVVEKVSYSKLVTQGISDGSQRPGVNISPAVSADGKTMYTASVAHFNSLDANIVAVNSDLTPNGTLP
jgi:hypothetical protein